MTSLDELGHTPLPPYIHEPLEDADRYQTMYARPLGSAAAPTAGLHFTGDLFSICAVTACSSTPVPCTSAWTPSNRLKWTTYTSTRFTANGRVCRPTRHGASTRRNWPAGDWWQWVRRPCVRWKRALCDRRALPVRWQTISQRDAAGETSNMCPWKPVAAFEGPTDLFLAPGYRFRAVDTMLSPTFTCPDQAC